MIRRLLKPIWELAGREVVAVLEIMDLCVNYGQIEALNNVNIRVGKDEIVALVGSNGAGKSTLLKTISGQVKPRSGEILF